MEDWMWDSDPRKLRKRIERAWHRGELHSIGPTSHVKPGVWAARVVRLRPAAPPPPRHSKPMAVAVLVGAVLILLAWCLLSVFRWVGGNAVAMTAVGAVDAVGGVLAAVRVWRFLAGPPSDG